MAQGTWGLILLVLIASQPAAKRSNRFIVRGELRMVRSFRRTIIGWTDPNWNAWDMCVPMNVYL